MKLPRQELKVDGAHEKCMPAKRRDPITVSDLVNCKGWAVGITGACGNELNLERALHRLREISREFKVTVQILDAGSIAGPIHLIHAARGAALAFDSKKLHAQSFGLEILCWAAGERQIKTALEKVGVTQNTREFALVSVGKNKKNIRMALAKALENLGLRANPQVLKLDPKKTLNLRKIFNIEETELRTAPLENLVIERVALLSVL